MEQWVYILLVVLLIVFLVGLSVFLFLYNRRGEKRYRLFHACMDCKEKCDNREEEK